MTDLATHTDPAERPDWQQEPVVVLSIEYRYRRTPIYRVKAPSRPHPWPQSKQAPTDDFIMKHFTEVK